MHAAFADAVLDKLCTSHPMSYRPDIVWKNYRVTAGMALYRERRIALSRVVLQTEDQVRDTLIHEYAHLLAVHRHGIRAGGHGGAWKQAMADLGLPARVRHTYEVTRNKPRQTVLYTCVRCGREIRRARRLPAKRRYAHANCGGAIRLKSVESKDRPGPH